MVEAEKVSWLKPERFHGSNHKDFMVETKKVSRLKPMVATALWTVPMKRFHGKSPQEPARQKETSGAEHTAVERIRHI